MIKILLSSNEREALFRAVQFVYRNGESVFGDRQHHDSLLDELDDGGIWNPCFLKIPRDDTQREMVLYCIKRGIDRGLGRHDLMNVEDRFLYVDARRDEPKTFSRWPFLTTGPYYGPQWQEKRLKIIERDSYQCSDCGISRKSHQEKYGQDLHVHHIKPKSECDSFEEANQPDNLETLCFDCHQRREYEKGEWL
ncbi:HNH endonuclease [Haloarcula sp. CBA1122]|uniref:HNH endonuclease n=1 Tax=Haloarcula sp. CBA1122 TaxID=2668069 RepID=UPI001306071C|nr:HNH endonuclease [Haloarcula sp. CBA1122]MUV50211.1 hypothetical protein [Haloarcula sp. CBA1122]